MKRFRLIVHPYALSDIQSSTDWYNEQLTALGTRFQRTVKQQINNLKTDAEYYSIRYDDVRCMLVKKSPFLIHYAIDEENELVEVFAVFHTSRDPQIWHHRNTNLK